jgi:hypothetical protein
VDFHKEVVRFPDLRVEFRGQEVRGGEEDTKIAGHGDVPAPVDSACVSDPASYAMGESFESIFSAQFHVL